MSLEEKLNHNEWIRWLLNKNHKEELWKILAFWEKYKREWEKLKREFWKERDVEKFVNLVWYYKKHKRECRKNFIEKLSREEKKMISSLSKVAMDKFYKEYLDDIVLYSWNSENIYNWGEGSIYNYWDLKRFKTEVVDIKKRMKPWMWIGASKEGIVPYEIKDEFLEILVKEWKYSLQPWMEIELNRNGFWKEWAELIAKEWKNSLQPWMAIRLWHNDIWDEWAQAIAKEWKGKLQPWMEIDLSMNWIWDEWARLEEWKDSLQPWMVIWLQKNDISKDMEKELKKWVQGYRNRWVKCEIKLWSLYS